MPAQTPAAPHVILNGELLPAAAARVSPLGDGFMFGHGAFETLRARAGRALHLDAHRTRLAAACAALDLAPPPPVAELDLRITRLLAAQGQPAAAVKIVRYRELSGTGELITTRPLPVTATDYLRGYRLKTFACPPRAGRPLAAHKTLNYLENLLARRAAREAGGDEALFITHAPDDLVLEGSATTLFIVKGGVVLTPPLALGILPGIARARVLAHLGPERAREETLSREALFAADEVFVTNALIGVMPVSRIDNRDFPSAAPVTAALANFFNH
ncbi:branched-chain amino acid aminotransferase/4-amino-4-deoxychorismate lyase [Opitutaceae bacterium TAV1]|nr:branched-chain amino acid aminotransferase/4-amino-4-deoxychorismate lyase [Opitutaceae bacterium TAV1]